MACAQTSTHIRKELTVCFYFFDQQECVNRNTVQQVYFEGIKFHGILLLNWLESFCGIAAFLQHACILYYS